MWHTTLVIFSIHIWFWIWSDESIQMEAFTRKVTLVVTFSPPISMVYLIEYEIVLMMVLKPFIIDTSTFFWRTFSFAYTLHIVHFFPISNFIRCKCLHAILYAAFFCIWCFRDKCTYFEIRIIRSRFLHVRHSIVLWNWPEKVVYMMEFDICR